jgi:hypothetical protein
MVQADIKVSFMASQDIYESMGLNTQFAATGTLSEGTPVRLILGFAARALKRPHCRWRSGNIVLVW